MLITLLFFLCNQAVAVTGELFKVTGGGGNTVSITLSLNINGPGPLSTQNYITQSGLLTLSTTVPNHTYYDAGIRINTPGYTYTANGTGFTITKVSVPKTTKFTTNGQGAFNRIGVPLTTTPQVVGRISSPRPLGSTWMSGNNTLNSYGVYGTQGVAAVGNVPGARNSSISWTQPSGVFWLFGGLGFSNPDDPDLNGSLNDLWQYNLNSGLWTWMSGSKLANQAGSYGIKGVAAPSNIPTGRELSISWTDASGNLWLFGGRDAATNSYNDLWKYNIQSGLWTWVSGSSSVNDSGVYGTQGIPAVGNIPGARSGSVSWTDASGNLWLFGGNNSVPDYYNDLWKYNIQSGLWTWVSGSNTPDASGIYGTKGTPAVANVPGARNGSISWTDANGALWLFGGSIPPFNYLLNDLWKYDITSNQWTWVSGSNTTSAHGDYGTQYVPAASNVPGARFASISWIDANGFLWLLGGYGYDSVGNLDSLNDLWKYNINSHQWTWINGSQFIDAPSVYGTQGVPAPENFPGSRQFSISWIDNINDDLWLFGGQDLDGSSSGLLNDLWRL